MKKMFFIALVLIFIFSFAACKTGNSNGSQTDDEPSLQVENNQSLFDETSEDEGVSSASSTDNNTSEPSVKSKPEETIPSLPTVSAGDTIKFGGSDWVVLTVQNDKTLVLKDKVIDYRAYHSAYENATWESCALRNYLNNEYYNLFSAGDKARIIKTKIPNKDNQWFETSGGNDTDDSIFLLSIEEVVKYFGDSGKLSNRPYEEWGYSYAIDDQYNSARKASDKASWWWLRSPGYNSRVAAFIYDDGRINIGGGSNSAYTGVNDKGGGVRPALWLSIS